MSRTVDEAVQALVDAIGDEYKQAMLGAMNGNAVIVNGRALPKERRAYKMSAETRARMSLGQKRRHLRAARSQAAAEALGVEAPRTAPYKKRKPLSEEQKAKMSESMRRLWAARKARANA